MKQAERAEQTRNKIVEAAMKEFGRNGYRGGTIGNICKTGINKGLVYHYFASKNELYLECVKISCEKLIGKLDGVGVSGAAAPDQSGTEQEPGIVPGTQPEKKSEPRPEPQDVVQQYMKARMAFYREYSDESRILFESLLDTPFSLRGQVREIMRPLEERNLLIYGQLLTELKLRRGVTREKAENYFILSQYMFNAYFSSPVMQEKTLDERISLHEQSIPEILDCMLYGIAESTSGSEKKREHEHQMKEGIER